MAWFRIARPPIVFISCLGVVVGALNSASYLGVKLSLFQLFMIIVGSAFLSAGLMIHNDVTDLRSDRVNRPYKPLPSGRIDLGVARTTGLSLMILAVVVSIFVNFLDNGLLNWKCGLLTLVVVLIGLYYNHFGKYKGILGNVAVAFGVGAIPYWGSLAVFPDELFIMFPLAFAIFVQEIGREIMVNAGDINGDMKAGYRTLPVLLGRRRSMYVALIFYLGFIPLFPIPYFGWLGADAVLHGPFYLVGASAFAFSLLLTWFLTFRVVLMTDDESRIWDAFERYERTGTRLMVIFFQFMLLMEAFYP